MKRQVHRLQPPQRAALALTIALAIVFGGPHAASAQSRSGTEGRTERSREERKETPAPKNETPTARARTEQPAPRQEAAPRREAAPRADDTSRSDARSGSRQATPSRQPERQSEGRSETQRQPERQPERRVEPERQPERRAEPERRVEPERQPERQPDRRVEPERQPEGRSETRRQPDRRSEPERRAEPERRSDSSARGETTRRTEPERRYETQHRKPIPVYEPRRDHKDSYYRDHPHVVKPKVHVSVRWPWQYRHHRHWEPHYRYRQVVYVEVGWGSNRRVIDVDVRTRYHQRVRYANGRYAEVDIFIDAIEIYRNGRYMGEVNRIPDELGHIQATIYRDGEVVFDRDVFLVGDPSAGFEMISTRHYDGYVLDRYRDGHGYRVGSLNLRRKRVYMRSYSRLFNPRAFNGYPPISLLPDDRNLLADFGDEAISYRYRGDDGYDPYYGGRYDDPYEYEDGGVRYNSNPYGDDYPQSRFGDGNTYQSNGVAPRVSTQAPAAPFASSSRNAFRTEAGADISFKREIELERIK